MDLIIDLCRSVCSCLFCLSAALLYFLFGIVFLPLYSSTSSLYYFHRFSFFSLSYIFFIVLPYLAFQVQLIYNNSSSFHSLIFMRELNYFNEIVFSFVVLTVKHNPRIKSLVFCYFLSFFPSTNFIIKQVLPKKTTKRKQNTQKTSLIPVRCKSCNVYIYNIYIYIHIQYLHGY